MKTESCASHDMKQSRQTKFKLPWTFLFVLRSIPFAEQYVVWLWCCRKLFHVMLTRHQNRTAIQESPWKQEHSPLCCMLPQIWNSSGPRAAFLKTTHLLSLNLNPLEYQEIKQAVDRWLILNGNDLFVCVCVCYRQTIRLRVRES